MIDVKEFLTVGQNAVDRKIVEKADTAGNYSTGLDDMLATPSCIDMVIRAAADATNKYLPEGFVTIGLSVNYIHDAPTVLGMTINVKATLVKIDGKRLVYEVEAWDELGTVGHGIHERLVVQQTEVVKKAKERTKFLAQRTS